MGGKIVRKSQFEYNNRYETAERTKMRLKNIRKLDQYDAKVCIFSFRPSQSYSVVYVNTLASSNAYSDFKKIMEFLPIEYFQHLSKIYVLHGNFKNKASFWMIFDYLGSYLKNKTYHADTFR